MKSLRSQKDIVANWKGNIDKPVVSIICSAYNHEAYIEETLESFLMQETDFPFEIIIHDDASTDHTADIIRKYKAKYSQLIRPVYQTVNRFSQGKRNGEILLPMARGKYIALCEGDDFWTDPLKLQKQVDFLEKNNDYVISGHDAFIVDENGKHIKESKLPDKYKKDFDGEDLILDKTWILTISWLFRAEARKSDPKEVKMVANVDTFLTSLLGHYGKSKYHYDIKPAAYRVHSGGVWSLKSQEERHDLRLNTFFWMYRYYKRIGEEYYAQYFLGKYQRLMLSKVKNKILMDELKQRIIYYILKPFNKIFR